VILLSEVETMKQILLVRAENAGKDGRLKLSPNAGESEKVLVNE
jgi:hypothetical protein